MTEILPIDRSDFLPVQSGSTNRLAARLGLLQPASRRLFRILLLIVVAWIPLVLFAGASGHITGDLVAITLLEDPEVNCRFLIAMPFLELAEVFLAVSLTAQVRQFLNSGIVSEKQRSRFEAIRAKVQRAHQAPHSEAIMLAIAFGTSLMMRLFVLADFSSTWERQSNVITLAGWWHLLVSLPLLYFFLLRALWVFGLWTWFLCCVSRLDLELTATHPDHAGGLGFLGWGLASFAPTVLSFSTVVSAGFAYEIYHRGESLQTLKYHLIAFVLLITFIIHLPVLPFAVRLARTRFQGLLEFSALVWRHDRAFDEKWIQQPQSENHESLLGTADVQSLADIATAYGHVDEMGIIPLDTKAVTVIAMACVIPLLPLVGTEIPLQEIIAKLGELLV